MRIFPAPKQFSELFLMFCGSESPYPILRSATDQIFCILQILEKTPEYNGTEHQLFRNFEKAYD
jgi:hypothetical protein